MFGHILVRHGVCLVQGIGDDDLAERLPRDARDVGRRQDGQQLLDPLLRLAAHGLRVGDQDGRRVGPMLGLRQQSTAQVYGSACSSATTRISIGPANRSMPTSPNSCRLASATNALPGPARKSTLGIVSVPRAMAAKAWTPPRR